MRKTTLLWLVLAGFCSTVLFHTSQRVHDEREKISSLETSIAKEEESLRVLNAEWSYLNQPVRLEKLAKTYLDMAPLKGRQFIKVEDIPLRSAAPEVAEATAAAPAEKKSEDKKISRPRIAAALPPSKPVVNIRKPVVAVALRKPAHTPAANPATATNTNTRSFSDLMKNLHAGVE